MKDSEDHKCNKSYEILIIKIELKKDSMEDEIIKVIVNGREIQIDIKFTLSQLLNDVGDKGFSIASVESYSSLNTYILQREVYKNNKKKDREGDEEDEEDISQWLSSRFNLANEREPKSSFLFNAFDRMFG